MADSPFHGIHGRSTADHLFRSAALHHMQLSAMADRKANIIITVTSIVLTLSLSQMMGNDLPISQIALVSLTGCTLIALLLAVLAVLPKFRPQRVGERIPEDFNILFFGHFASLPMERFEREMGRILHDDDLIYEALTRDLYGLGVYLQHHKYRYLRWSYLFFLAGFFVATIAEATWLLSL